MHQGVQVTRPGRQQCLQIAIARARVYGALDKQCDEADKARDALPFPACHKNAEQLVENLLTRIKAVRKCEELAKQRREAYDDLLLSIRSLADFDK